MPGGDGTGPLGMGPTTGRQAGYCAGAGAPGFVSPQVGGLGGRRMGFGRGRGLGRSLGWLASIAAGGLLVRGVASTISRAREKAVLTEQASAIEEALGSIKQRLSELDQDEQPQP